MDEKSRKPDKPFWVKWMEFGPFWVSYKIIRLTPLRIAYAMFRFVFGTILFYGDPKHRNRTIQHLLHANVVKSTKEAAILAREVFAQMGMLFVEIAKKDQVFSIEKVKLVGAPETLKELDEMKREGQNAIVLTAHYGCWELAATSWVQLSGMPMVTIMRAFDNEMIGDYVLRKRKGDGVELIDKAGGLKEMLRALRQGQSIALLADQHAGRHTGGVLTTFFGQPCRTHSSPAILHLKTGVPIVIGVARRCDDECNIEFDMGEVIRYEPTNDKEKDIQVVTQLYTSILEKLIAKRPEQWVWAHRRWLNINRKSWEEEAEQVNAELGIE